MSIKRKTIAVDVDDVLSASAEGFAEYSNLRWGAGVKPEDYTEEWAVFWNVPLKEAVKRSVEFHQSDTVSRYRHFDGALPILRNLRDRYNLIVVTSRQSVLKSHTDVWLEEHFPGIFSDTHYAGIWDSGQQVAHMLKRTKAELCRELGADYLIDDQLKHCVAAHEVGIVALLFGDYSWNKEVPTAPGGIIRVPSWQAVGEYFDGQD